MFVPIVLVSVCLAVAASGDFSSESTRGYDLPGLPPRSRRVVGGPLCENSAAFALTGALEIGYQRLTGNVPVKLSEQEIVDCFYSGCGDADLGHLIKWLNVQQRLAPEDGYTSFMGGLNRICRAAPAPNVLEVELKLMDGELIAIKAADVDEWLKKSGFVFARMSTGKYNCSAYYKSKISNQDDRGAGHDTVWITGEGGHVVTGNDTIFSDTNVLIVGIYKDDDQSEYYIVRDSRGDTWMRRGHFLIPRGGNICGIEYNLKAAELSLIDNEVVHEPEKNCPELSPKWCEDTKTCTKEYQGCVTNETPDLKEYDPETSAPANKNKVWDFTGRPECQDKDGYESECAEICKTWKMCMNKKIQDVCAGTCLLCARDTCEDHENTPGECGNYTRFCGVGVVRAMCSRTCQLHPNDCGSMEDNIHLLTGIKRPSTGTCYPPVIENGRVLNSGMLQNGEKLEIECDPGLTLVGEQNYCVVQNLYGPDSRIMQACVQIEDEDWAGNGENYKGQKSTTLQSSECKNWRMVIAQGLFNPAGFNIEHGRVVLKQGASFNHNFCRNPDGEELVPWCFTSDINMSMYSGVRITFQGMDPPQDDILNVGLSEIMYCYPRPKCAGDYCSSTKNDSAFCFSMDPQQGVCTWDNVKNERKMKFCPNLCCSTFCRVQ